MSMFIDAPQPEGSPPPPQPSASAAQPGGTGVTHHKNYRTPLLVAVGLVVAGLVALAAVFDDPVTVTWTLLAVAGCGALLAVLSTAMEMLCVEWVVPWLLQVQVSTEMSDDIAGVTLMALGNSFPTVAIAMITTLNGEFALSLGVLLGSGLVSFGAVPPACFFAATGGGLTHDNRQTLKLRAWPVLRDTVGYIGALVAVGVILAKDGTQVGAGSALALVGYYVVYVTLALVVPVAMNCASGDYFDGDSGPDTDNEHEPLLGDPFGPGFAPGYSAEAGGGGGGGLPSIPGAPRWSSQAAFKSLSGSLDDGSSSPLPPLAGAAGHRGVGAASASEAAAAATAAESSPRSPYSNRNHSSRAPSAAAAAEARPSALEYDHEESEDESGNFGGSGGAGSEEKGGGDDSTSGCGQRCWAPVDAAAARCAAGVLAVPGLWSNVRQRCLDALRAAVAYTVPKPPRVAAPGARPGGMVLLGVSVGLGWLALFSQGLYAAAWLLCALIPGLNANALGSLLLVTAAQTPDFFVATAMAKAGLHQGGVSSTTSSQVLLLTLGLGLPWLLYVSVDGAYVTLELDLHSGAVVALLLSLCGLVAVGFAAACLGPRACPDCFDGGVGSGCLGGYGGRDKGAAGLGRQGSLWLLGAFGGASLVLLLVEILHAAGVVS